MALFSSQIRINCKEFLPSYVAACGDAFFINAKFKLLLTNAFLGECFNQMKMLGLSSA